MKLSVFGQVYLMLLVCAIAIVIGGEACAVEYDFDQLNDNASSTPSTKTQTIDGVVNQSEKALQRQRESFQKEEEAKARAAEAAAARYRAERALGNGNRYYECEFSCRADGFLMYDRTDKMKQTVKADEAWQAENLVKDNAKEICRSITRGTPKHMWLTGLSCSEKR